MLLLRNTVRPYDWGAVDGIADLVGSAPTGGPEAELWVGTHPGAPSRLAGDGDTTLASVIEEDPARWLGTDLADGGERCLPFLLKILSIGAPLSLQAHPSIEQARAGFAREEAAGIAPEANERIYKDTGAKPEALVALVETWALCGFREPADAADLVASVGLRSLDPLVEILRRGDAAALEDALRWLLHPEGGRPPGLVPHVRRAVAGARDDRRDPRTWVRHLADRFPADPACAAPLLLELVRLEPGEAVHLPAGNLHAYLEGAGVEIMAASDNVLRGGLTSKHVDIEELLAVLRVEPGVPAAPLRKDHGNGLTTYDAGESAFALARIDPSAGPVEVRPTGPSLLLATGAEVDVAGPDGGLTLSGGDGAFVPPDGGPLVVTGPGALWWATVGHALPR